MRKYLLQVFIGLLFLTGCAKAIPAKEAATLFVEQLVYQKEETKFTENFQNGKELTKNFEANAALFQDTFASGLVAADTEVSEETAVEISQLLMEKVRSATDYQVKVTETDSVRNVSYEIYGLDIVAVMKQTTEKVTEAMLADTSLAKDETKLQKQTILELKQVLQAPPVKTEPVTVMLEMKPVKGKWTVVAGQQAEQEKLYLAFVAGVKDQETLTNDWQQAQDELTKELAEKMK